MREKHDIIVLCEQMSLKIKNITYILNESKVPWANKFRA